MLTKIRPGRVITELQPGSRTQQHYRDENNPNLIMKRYNSSGQITGRFRDRADGKFVDCPATVKSFLAARDLYLNVESTFAELPVEVRAHYEYQPERLLQALENPNERETLVKLGVLKPVIETPPEPPPEPPAGTKK